MQTLIIQLKSKNAFQALYDLQARKMIRIVREADDIPLSLEGEPISEEDFKKWVECAEKTPTVSLTEAKKRWQAQKKKLKENAR